jgi:class 3 adenylate cyclase
MREQPSGSVTLVFTDIEGSTRLLRELGEEGYRDALAAHRRVVREAFASGYEVDEEGDVFFYAFTSAGTAVAAVEQAMRGLERGRFESASACIPVSPS